MEKSRRVTKPTLYLLGTVHSSASSKKDVREVIEKHRFDIIFSEGLHGRPSLSSVLKEPLFVLAVIPYIWMLSNLGSEFRVAEELAKEKGIRFENIDYEINHLIENGHKWYNYIIGILITAGCYIHPDFTFSVLMVLILVYLLVKLGSKWEYGALLGILVSVLYLIFIHKFPSQLLLVMISALVLSSILYMAYFALLKTPPLRNKRFVESVDEFRSNKKFRLALVVCGKAHCDYVKKYFQDKVEIVIL